MSRKTNRRRRNLSPKPETQTHVEPKLLVDEHELAATIGMSVHWLRKDRLHNRTVPFVRIGAAIRYHPPTVQRALLDRMEGGRSVSSESKAA
jgi:hypothetical protein